MNSSKVGKTIAFLRKHYKLTQHELAEKLGVTDKAVSRWENGYGTPDISLLSKLATVLDIDIESILEGNLTHWDMEWEGLLFLNYPEGISPLDRIYGIRIVELQLSLFALVGISKVMICGADAIVFDVKKVIGDGFEYGCVFEYRKIDIFEETILKKVKVDINANCPLMVIEGSSFVYGKDLTKLFRRILYDGKGVTKLIGHNGQPCYIEFAEKEAFREEDDTCTVVLERGMISFTIRDRDDLFDASDLLRIIEKHSNERVYDLKDIAIRRGLIWNS